MRRVMDPAQLYQAFALWIGNGTGLTDTVLHIHAGLAVLVIARILTGRSLGTAVPLSIVIVATIVKEGLDRIVYDSWRWPDTLSDVAHTLFWPAVICLGVRLRPLIAARRSTILAAVPVDEAAQPLGEHDPGAIAGQRVQR